MLSYVAATTLALVLSGAAAPQDPPPQRPVTTAVPAGTVVPFRLRQMVSTYITKVYTPITAMVVQDVVVGGHPVIPMGSELTGTVTAVRRVGAGIIHERAYVDLAFDAVQVPHGPRVPIAPRVTRVDDARETVDVNGRINGIRATASATSIIATLITSTGFIDPMLLCFTMSASMAAFRIPESEIVFPAGTELRGVLTAPATVAAPPPPPAEVFMDAPARAALAATIERQPYRTTTELTGAASDVTNLGFVGTADQVERAFAAAGWGQTDALNGYSSYLALRAIIENQGYREAPMSTLVLAGQRPVLTYAKTLNTFFSRHHLRVFASADSIDGVPLFTSSSTHDSGIGFATKRKSFIHVIDENIDEERDKVVSDLRLTGCVDAVAYVPRPWLPDELSNSTGDRLRTDKQIAVLKLNDCTAPVRADYDIVAKVDTETGLPSILGRSSRNVALSIKNDLWRGNIFYQTYAVGRFLVGKVIGTHDAPDASAGDAPPQYVDIAGERFMVVPGSVAQKQSGGGTDVARAAAAPPKPRVRYDPRLVFSFFGGGARTIGATTELPVSMLVDLGNGQGVNYPLRFVTSISGRDAMGARVTLRTGSHVSQEFSFTSNRVRFGVNIVDDLNLVPSQALSAPAKIRQFVYNVSLHPFPNGTRIRPYVSLGPTLQLLRLDEAVTGDSPRLRFAFKDVTLIKATWDFGSKPPLEGGGIFQVGLSYGAGVQVHVTRNLLLRTDVRETLSKQPNWWEKSAASLVDIGVTPGTYRSDHPLRLRVWTFTLGYGF